MRPEGRVVGYLIILNCVGTELPNDSQMKILGVIRLTALMRLHLHSPRPWMSHLSRCVVIIVVTPFCVGVIVIVYIYLGVSSIT